MKGKKMKKIIIFSLLLMTSALLSGCEAKTTEITAKTTYPEYLGTIEYVDNVFDCQTILETKTHKVIVDGCHKFEIGSKVYVVTLYSKGGLSVTLINVPEYDKITIVRKIDTVYLED